MLILLTGIPGAGKTTIGEHLQENHGWLHVDMEALIMSFPAGTQWSGVLAALERRRRDHENVVISWGFMPGQDEPVVQALRRAGYRLIWLDGDREAARRAFLQRGTVSEDLLNAQMARIARFNLALLNPIVIDPFDDQGVFRPPADIAAEILAAAGAP